MSLLVIGISHKTAPIQLREQLVFNKQQLSYALLNLSEVLETGEVAILSTCHRTEIYCSENIPVAIKRWLESQKNIVFTEFEPHLYQHWGVDAVKHVMSVASGIDSSIIGEPQIFGQMKQAYQTALGIGAVGKLLDRLFQSSFMVAKQVRSQTDIGKSPVSLAYTAVKMATQIFSNLEETSILYIGAGETIELCARHFHERNVKSMIFANRTHSKAEQLAEHFNGSVITFENIAENLQRADIIVTATGSDNRLITKKMMELALNIRKRRPVFMIDLAMPRDIEQEVTQLPEIYLYTVDDLQAIVDDNYKLRMQAVSTAENIICRQADDFMLWHERLNSVDVIREYRTQAEDIRDKATLKALQALKKGQDPTDVVKTLSRQLTNQLIHEPTVVLRDIASSDDEEALANIKKMFLGSDNKD